MKPKAYIPSSSVFKCPAGRLGAAGAGLILFFLSAGVYAEDELQRWLEEPIVNMTETSEPIIDPGLFKEKVKPTDPFFDKIRSDREDFQKDLLEWKRETFQKIKNKNLPDETRQKKFAEFHKEYRERQIKFNRKEQEKINKYMRKDTGSLWTKWF